jgi:hypothetical protein
MGFATECFRRPLTDIPITRAECRLFGHERKWPERVAQSNFDTEQTPGQTGPLRRHTIAKSPPVAETKLAPRPNFAHAGY